MHIQHRIKHTLGQPENLEQICQKLQAGQAKNRSALASQLCGQFGFLDPRGRKQLGTCLKALRDLEKEGHFSLPSASLTGRHAKPSPRRLLEAVPPPEAVPPAAGEVKGLGLIMVETEAQIRIWNEMMAREHPQGAGPLVGRQLRYLIASEHGWLGGLGFAAAALKLTDREQWLGWDDATRMQHLQRIVGMSRYLIRPQVHCRNLASQVLGMALRRLAQDFESRFGFEPLLVESFVDNEAFAGTCYQASNWVKIGQTQGRGRQDRKWTCPSTVKDIYVYPLRPDFRTQMGAAEPEGRPMLAIAEGLEGAEWAENEFGGARLGDRRLGERLVESARMLAEHPGEPFSGVAKGNWPAAKGYYRMIDHPDDGEVTMAAILAPHRERTVQRMKAQPVVLCIQDGSDLNYMGLAECDGLGVLGANQTGARSQGLHLHSMLAVTPQGLPLGVLSAQCDAPEPKAKDDKRPKGTIPIEEKKTFAWIQGMRDCIDLAPQLPETRIVCVMDREADFSELFEEQRRKRRVDLLVRAKHNRNLRNDLKFFEVMRESPAQDHLKIPVPRQSARPKKSKQQAREPHPQRIAEVALHYRQVEFQPSTHVKDACPFTLGVVHVREENPPEGANPLEWFLLTSREIATSEDAQECLRWYALRWRIEDWHRVLKSGCSVEKLAHKTAERLKRAIAINLVIAWRIMLMTLMGRAHPDLPAELLFSDLEITLLQAFADTMGGKKKLQPSARLGDAVTVVAKLGGYLDRNNDPPPGHQLMWRGFAYLQGMCLGFTLRDHFALLRDTSG
jgi:hypothetical protein